MAGVMGVTIFISFVSVAVALGKSIFYIFFVKPVYLENNLPKLDGGLILYANYATIEVRVIP